MTRSELSRLQRVSCNFRSARCPHIPRGEIRQHMGAKQALRAASCARRLPSPPFSRSTRLSGKPTRPPRLDNCRPTLRVIEIRKLGRVRPVRCRLCRHSTAPAGAVSPRFRCNPQHDRISQQTDCVAIRCARLRQWENTGGGNPVVKGGLCRPCGRVQRPQVNLGGRYVTRRGYLDYRRII